MFWEASQVFSTYHSQPSEYTANRSLKLYHRYKPKFGILNSSSLKYTLHLQTAALLYNTWTAENPCCQGLHLLCKTSRKQTPKLQCALSSNNQSVNGKLQATVWQHYFTSSQVTASRSTESCSQQHEIPPGKKKFLRLKSNQTTKNNTHICMAG